MAGRLVLEATPAGTTPSRRSGYFYIPGVAVVDRVLPDLPDDCSRARLADRRRPGGRLADRGASAARPPRCCSPSGSGAGCPAPVPSRRSPCCCCTPTRSISTARCTAIRCSCSPRSARSCCWSGGTTGWPAWSARWPRRGGRSESRSRSAWLSGCSRCSPSTELSKCPSSRPARSAPSKRLRRNPASASNPPIRPRRPRSRRRAGSDYPAHPRWRELLARSSGGPLAGSGRAGLRPGPGGLVHLSVDPVR